ncbi:MAG: hypothetical protein ACI3ZO_09765 [Candidatus Cryptobacteroides sp.]
MKHYTILYIHGMGGGTDSRIPSFLNGHIGEFVPEEVHINVIVRTYDIDPDLAFPEISKWFAELEPDLVIGESLGSLHALRLHGVPHLFVSPAIGAAGWMSAVSRIPGAAWVMRRLYQPYSPERQTLDFTQKILSHYAGIREEALSHSPLKGGNDYFFAFFGTADHYRRFGVVSVRRWRKYFGRDSYKIYKGTHFMENEYLYTMLIPKILEVLGL